RARQRQSRRSAKLGRSRRKDKLCRGAGRAGTRLNEVAMLGYFVHDFNPVIFKLGGFEPRWYGFAYLLGFLGAYWLLMRLARQGMLRIPMQRVPDLVLNSCIFGVLIGGRLGYCLFYDQSLLGAARNAEGNIVFPYWGVLAVWHGGMSAHGG